MPRLPFVFITQGDCFQYTGTYSPIHGPKTYFLRSNEVALKSWRHDADDEGSGRAWGGMTIDGSAGQGRECCRTLGGPRGLRWLTNGRQCRWQCFLCTENPFWWSGHKRKRAREKKNRTMRKTSEKKRKKEKEKKNKERKKEHSSSRSRFPDPKLCEGWGRGGVSEWEKD